jgi:hypothetical protein
LSPTRAKKSCVSGLAGRIAAIMSRPLTPAFDNPAFARPLCGVYAVVEWAEIDRILRRVELLLHEALRPQDAVASYTK